MPKPYYFRDGPIVDGAPRREEYEIAEMSDLPVVPEVCPAPMTRAALLGLAGSYRTECHYVINDHDRGTVGPALIMLHATDADTLSMNVSVQTDHDDMAWLGVYDIGADRFRHLRDNVRNEVTGQATIEAFPWGATGVTNNVVHNASLNYVAGTFSGIISRTKQLLLLTETSLQITALVLKLISTTHQHRVTSTVTVLVTSLMLRSVRVILLRTKSVQTQLLTQVQQVMLITMSSVRLHRSLCQVQLA